MIELTLPQSPKPAQDLDKDGVYEDIDGNDIVNRDDLVLFFNNMEVAEVKENSTVLDFNGNGRIDFYNIVQLSKTVTGD